MAKRQTKKVPEGELEDKEMESVQGGFGLPNPGATRGFQEVNETSLAPGILTPGATKIVKEVDS